MKKRPSLLENLGLLGRSLRQVGEVGALGAELAEEVERVGVRGLLQAGAGMVLARLSDEELEAVAAISRLGKKRR